MSEHKRLRHATAEKGFVPFGQVTEEEAIQFYYFMMTKPLNTGTCTKSDMPGAKGSWSWSFVVFICLLQNWHSGNIQPANAQTTRYGGVQITRPLPDTVAQCAN